MTNAVAIIEDLIKFIGNGDQDDLKSDACMNAGPAIESNQYKFKGSIQTLKAAQDSSSKLSDLEVYYSAQIDPKQNIKNAVILFYDIFGWNTKNKNVFELCDKIFAQGNGQYYVIMPDIYRGNGWPVNKEIKMDEIMAWAAKVATFEIVTDDMSERILPALRQNKIENICFVGLCWGGTMGFRLGQLATAHSDMFAGLASIHGSRINDELCQNMKIPVCYCPTAKDQPLEAVKSILDTKGFGAKCVYKLYENMCHGFTAGRGDYNNKENLEAVTDVVKLASTFFKSVFNKSDAEDSKCDADDVKVAFGGRKQADTTDLTEAANAVRDDVQKMDDEKFSCYEVVSGHKQVVAGINYQIKVRVGENKFAEMKVYRSLPPFQYELKNVAFSTTEVPMVGAFGQAAETQEMTEAANAVRAEIEKQAENMGKAIKMFEVQHGRKQVVAGMNYKIRVKVDENRFCEIRVYRSLPPFSYELKNVIWIEPPPVQIASRPIVGGFGAADKDELNEVANAVRDDVQKMDDEKFSCYEAVSGSKQVVAGMNYEIKVKVGENKFAEIRVFRSLPPVRYELNNVAFVTTEAPIFGGFGEVAETEEMNAAANAVRAEIEKQAEDMGKAIKMFEIQEGRQQVVAGMNYKIKIKVDVNRFCEIRVFRSLPPVSYELKNVIWIEP